MLTAAPMAAERADFGLLLLHTRNKINPTIGIKKPRTAHPTRRLLRNWLDNHLVLRLLARLLILRLIRLLITLAVRFLSSVVDRRVIRIRPRFALRLFVPLAV